MNPTSQVLLKRSFSFNALFVILLFQCLSGSLSAVFHKNPGDYHPDIKFKEMANISIHLNKKAIQASSLNEQILPMMVSCNIEKVNSSYQKPVDLILVFELPEDREKREEEIEDLRDYRLPNFVVRMNDYDRLWVVIFDEHNGNPSAVPMPLINTTHKNFNKICSSVSKNIFKEKMSIERSLEIALEILSKRNETNQTTGIFIERAQGNRMELSTYHKIMMEKTDMEDIEKAKQTLGIQDKGLIIQPLYEWSSDDTGVTALRAGVVETRLVIKPEESEVFKDVKILNTYKWGTVEEGWMPEEDGKFIMRCLSFEHVDRPEMMLDLKIPPITKALPSSPIEVNVASSQLIFILANGSQVTKEANLTVKIIGEEEEYTNEEDNKEALSYFYQLWRDRIWRTVYTELRLLTKRSDITEKQIREGRELVTRFFESLENSALRDDRANWKRLNDGKTMWNYIAQTKGYMKELWNSILFENLSEHEDVSCRPRDSSSPYFCKISQENDCSFAL